MGFGKDLFPSTSFLYSMFFSQGLLVSSMCDTELGAVQIAMGAFYPVLLLSGILWPLQAMPTWLKYISYIFPTTHAAEAMRSIFGRG